MGVWAGPVRWLPPLVGATERIAADRLSGFGLAGHDPVSYRLDGQARPGLANFEAIHAGLAWRFAGPANRAAFLQDPDAFLPRIGGYDAVAAAAGRLVDADPTIFAVRDDRVYLFRTSAERSRFLREEAIAAAAEAAWLRLHPGLGRN